MRKKILFCQRVSFAVFRIWDNQTYEFCVIVVGGVVAVAVGVAVVVVVVIVCCISFDVVHRILNAERTRQGTHTQQIKKAKWSDHSLFNGVNTGWKANNLPRIDWIYFVYSTVFLYCVPSIPTDSYIIDLFSIRTNILIIRTQLYDRSNYVCADRLAKHNLSSIMKIKQTIFLSALNLLG